MAEETNVTQRDGAGAEATGQSNLEGQATETTKTYSEADFQAEVDRRVTEGVKTAKAKWQAEYEKKLQAEKDEAAKLAKLSAEDRAKAQFDKQKKEFEDERAKYNAERLEFECAKQLSSEGLSVEFASILTGKDADTTKANIATFKTAFSKAVEAAVTDRLRGEPPKTHTEQETDPFLNGFGV